MNLKRELEARERAQMCARGELDLRVPREVGALLNAAIRAAREAAAGSWLSPGECLTRIAEHFVETWEEALAERSNASAPSAPSAAKRSPFAPTTSRWPSSVTSAQSTANACSSRSASRSTSCAVSCALKCDWRPGRRTKRTSSRATSSATSRPWSSSASARSMPTLTAAEV
jgi:hypothetical protein